MEENKNEKPELKKEEKVEKPEEKKVEAEAKTKKDEPKANQNNVAKKEEKTNEKKDATKKDEPKKAMDPEKKKKIIKIAVIAVILVAIIVAVIVYFAVFHKKTIDLADFVEVTYYTETSNSYYYDESDNPSYNGYSTASVSIDVDKLKDFLDSRRAAERFAEKTTLTIENENNGNLSNGETLNVKVEISSNYLDDEKLKLKSETLSFPIEGLEEADVLDLFGEEDFEVEVTGISPDLRVSVNNNSSNEFIKENVSYSVDEYSGIANGDTVTITAYYDETAALDEGIVIAQDTYEYTVDGMPEYVDSTEDLTDAALEAIRTEFVANVNEEIDYQDIYVLTYNYDDVDTSAGYTNTEPELVATYLLTRKGSTSSWNPENRVCAIYKVIYTATATGTNYEWYYVASTSDVAVQDGNLYNGDELYYDTSGRWDEGKTQEEAYDALIDTYKGNYVIETVE